MSECKHEEICQILAGEIAQKIYPDRFPPVRDLASRFQVSTRTMTKALKPLIKQGLIIPDGPRGCRIAPQDLQRPRSGIVGIFAAIGKIVPREDPLIGPLLELIERDNCTPLLTDVPRTEVIRDLDFWRSNYLDGYIFVYSSFNQKLANFLRSEGIAFVAANRLPESFNAPWADFDHYQAFCKLYDHLRKNGSRRIALLDKPSFSNSLAYSSDTWHRVQEYWQVPEDEQCGTFGMPVEGEDYRKTLTGQLGELCKNGQWAEQAMSMSPPSLPSRASLTNPPPSHASYPADSRTSSAARAWGGRGISVLATSEEPSIVPPFKKA